MGEDPPTCDQSESQALEAWGYLSNGMGGLDWSGLETIVTVLGIVDVEGLVHRLKTIKLYRPPEGLPEPQE